MNPISRTDAKSVGVVLLALLLSAGAVPVLAQTGGAAVINTGTVLGTPHISQVVYSVYSNQQAAIFALEHGDVDMLGFPLTNAQVQSLAGQPSINISYSPASLNFMSLDFNVRGYNSSTSAPSDLSAGSGEALTSIQFRKAFIPILGDRSQLVKPVFGPLANPQYGVLPLGYKDWINPNVELALSNKLPAQNFTLANSLLDAAGFKCCDSSGYRTTPTGQSFKIQLMYVTTNPQDQDAALILAGLVSQYVKVNMVATGVDLLTFISSVFHAHRWDTYIFSGNRLGPYPDGIWSSLYSVSSSHDISGLENSTLESLISQIPKSTSFDQERSLIYQIQQVLMDNFVETNLATFTAATAYRTDKFTGFTNPYVFGTGGQDPVPLVLDSIRLKDGSNGGIFKIAVLNDISTNDPFNAVGGSVQNDIYTLANVYEPLFWTDIINGAPAFVPLLAANWTTTETTVNGAPGQVVTFHLRAGIAWSDGQPLTSADVLFSINLAQNKSVSAYAHPAGLIVVNATAPDDHTVVVKLNTPQPTALAKLGGNGGVLWIVPKHIWSSVTDPARVGPTTVVGSGPFLWTQWSKGEFIELSANSGYYLPALGPSGTTTTTSQTQTTTSVTSSTSTTSSTSLSDYLIPLVVVVVAVIALVAFFVLRRPKPK